jgi:hypothetical protein
MDSTTGIAAPPAPQSHRRSGTPQVRWACVVAAVVTADEDIPTLEAWAAHVHMSQRTLCHRCRAARAPAKASLTLARLLRTLTVGDPRAWRPEDALSAVDPRTIDRMWIRAPSTGWCQRRVSIAFAVSPGRRLPRSSPTPTPSSRCRPGSRWVACWA